MSTPTTPGTATPTAARPAVTTPLTGAPQQPGGPVDAPLVLLGLSGSLRRASTNTALLRAAAELAPDGVEVVLHPLHGLPFYDGDLESAGSLPPAVERLRAAIGAADGLLLASPEYNWSTTAVLKNALDWASRGRPAPIDHQPTALLSAAGSSGGRRAQAHLRDVLGHNRVDVLDDAVQLRGGGDLVVAGRLVDPDARTEVAALTAALVERIRARRAERSAA
jgi:chromate reductase